MSSWNKPIGLFMAAVLFYNSLGGLALWQAEYKQVRRGVKQALIAGVPDESLTKFVFSKAYYNLIKTEPEEFRHEGRMYDVVRMSEQDGYLYIYCLADKEEDELNEQLGNLLSETQTQTDGHKTKDPSFFKQLQYLAAESTLLPAVEPEIGDYAILTSRIASRQGEVFTPPPETGYLLS